jgi:hypothetical protein
MPYRSLTLFPSLPPSLPPFLPHLLLLPMEPSTSSLEAVGCKEGGGGGSDDAMEDVPVREEAILDARLWVGGRKGGREGGREGGKKMSHRRQAASSPLWGVLPKVVFPSLPPSVSPWGEARGRPLSV